MPYVSHNSNLGSFVIDFTSYSILLFLPALSSSLYIDSSVQEKKEAFYTSMIPAIECLFFHKFIVFRQKTPSSKMRRCEIPILGEQKLDHINELVYFVIAENKQVYSSYQIQSMFQSYNLLV